MAVIERAVPDPSVSLARGSKTVEIPWKTVVLSTVALGEAFSRLAAAMVPSANWKLSVP